MGRLGLVLSFERRSSVNGNTADVKLDFGDGDVAFATYYAPPGDDANPLPGDFALCVPGGGRGEWCAVGFLDPKIAGEAGPGERIVYSRSAPGVIATKLHLKADGSATLTLGGPAAKVVEFTADGDVVADGISLKTHTHGYIDSIGDPPAATPSVTDPPS